MKNTRLNDFQDIDFKKMHADEKNSLKFEEVKIKVEPTWENFPTVDISHVKLEKYENEESQEVAGKDNVDIFPAPRIIIKEEVNVEDFSVGIENDTELKPKLINSSQNSITKDCQIQSNQTKSEFDDLKILKDLQTRMTKTETQSQSDNFPAGKIFSCNECGKKFMWSKEVRRHKMIVHGVYKCNLCKKRYLYLGKYNIHKKNKHKVFFGYNCEICGKAFFDERKLGKHLRSHKWQKLVRCHRCNKKFDKDQNFASHECAYTKEQFQCKICDKYFTENSSLRDHELKFHGGNNSMKKKVVCDLCCEPQKSYKTLQIHKRQFHQSDEFC